MHSCQPLKYLRHISLGPRSVDPKEPIGKESAYEFASLGGLRGTLWDRGLREQHGDTGPCEHQNGPSSGRSVWALPSSITRTVRVHLDIGGAVVVPLACSGCYTDLFADVGRCYSLGYYLPSTLEAVFYL